MDDIFELELENVLLKQLPFSKQNNIIYQKQVNEKVKNFVKLYKLSSTNVIFKNELIKKQIYNYNFENLVIPITEHKRRIFLSKDEDSDTGNNHFFYTTEHIDLERYRKIEEDFKTGNIYFKEYNNELSKLISDAYININKQGLAMCPVKPFDSLNNYNIKHVDWTMKRNIDKHCLYLKEESEIKKECLIYGDDTNIIGFAILDELEDNIYNLLSKNSIYKNSKIGKIDNILNISKGKNAIFTCPKHNLNNNNYIIIKNSDLPINGIYYKELNVINDDTFTLNINTSEMKITGNLGELYGKLNLSINKLHMFNKKITKSEYYDVIDKNIPSIKDIIINKIKKINNLNDFFEFINFFIYNKFNYLDFNHMCIINNLLNEKITNILKKKENLIIKELNKKEDIEFILSDKFIKSKEISEIYGICPYDTTLQRLNWIQSQTDNGEFYYSYLLKNIENIKRTKDLVKIYQKKIKNIEEKLEKSKECLKFKYEIETIEQLDDLKDYKKGDYAFVIDNYKIFIYNGVKWENIKNLNESTSLKELCLFKNNDLSKIKLSDITCDFKDNECILKNYNEYLKLYENYKIILEDLESNKINKNNYELSLKKLQLLKYTKKSNILNENENETNIFKFRQIDFYNQIFRISEKEEMRFSLFKALAIDGIMINNTIFSKKYKLPIICGHWHYIIMNEKSTLKNKKKIAETMLNKFGIAKDGVISCKNCGAILDLVDYDDISFTKDGKLVISRTPMQNNSKKLVKKGENDISFQKINCNSKNFTDFLINKGIIGKNLEIGIDVCNIIKLLSSKVGVLLKTADLINIIIHSIEEITKLYNYNTFKSIKKQLLVKQGKEDIIDKLERSDFFKNKHFEYYILNKYSYIACIFLIYIQSSIPKYVLKNPKTSCTLSSIEEKRGIEYITCIVKEINVLNYEYYTKNKKKKVKTIDQKEIYENFEDNYYKLLKKETIKELFKKREEYDKLISIKIDKRKEDKKFISILKGNKIPDELPSNYTNYLLGKKGKIDIHNDFIRYYKRDKYVNMEIMNIIEYIVSSYDLEKTLTIVNFCCASKIKKNNSYLNYIISKNK